MIQLFSPATPATVYYLPGTTGWGAMFDGLPTAPWFLPNPVILNNGPGFGVQPGGFGFTISWATNVSVVVEAATNLANPVWIPVSTNTLTGGTSLFQRSAVDELSRSFLPPQARNDFWRVERFFLKLAPPARCFSSRAMVV